MWLLSTVGARIQRRSTLPHFFMNNRFPKIHDAPLDPCAERTHPIAAVRLALARSDTRLSLISTLHGRAITKSWVGC